MKSDLDLLIEACKKEEKTLQRFIKTCITEYDYLLAHYHSEALQEIQNRLRVLNSFRDPLHNQRREIELYKISIKRIKLNSGFNRPNKKPSKKDMINRIRESWETEIKNKEAELEALSTNVNNYFLDGEKIDDALFKLYGGEIEGFKVTIDDYQIELVFEIKDKYLFISINTNEFTGEDDSDFLIDDRTSKPLDSLGFKFDNTHNLYVYQLKMDNFKDANPVKIFLSRLLFDVFKLYDVHQAGMLSYF